MTYFNKKKFYTSVKATKNLTIEYIARMTCDYLKFSFDLKKIVEGILCTFNIFSFIIFFFIYNFYFLEWTPQKDHQI